MPEPTPIIGKVTLPEIFGYGGIEAHGLVKFFNNLFKLLVLIAGLYVLLNLILAGYSFISAGGDPKNVEKAWAKIWQSLVGLLIIASAFVLTAIFGWLLFGDTMIFVRPIIYGPGGAIPPPPE